MKEAWKKFQAFFVFTIIQMRGDGDVSANGRGLDLC